MLVREVKVPGGSRFQDNNFATAFAEALDTAPARRN